MPLKEIYIMEPGVNWYTFDEQDHVLISKNLGDIPDDEILYVHRSKRTLSIPEIEMEVDGMLYQVRKDSYEWFPY